MNRMKIKGKIKTFWIAAQKHTAMTSKTLTFWIAA